MADPANEQPDDHDVVIWHLPDRDQLDVYCVTKGSKVLGEFTGRSIGSDVFRAAIEQTERGRFVWLRDEHGFRRIYPRDPLVGDIPDLD